MHSRLLIASYEAIGCIAKDIGAHGLQTASNLVITFERLLAVKLLSPAKDYAERDFCRKKDGVSSGT